VLAGPATGPASAATVSVDNRSTISYAEAAGGELNRLTVTQEDDDDVFTDVVAIEPGAGCRAGATPNVARCTEPSLFSDRRRLGRGRLDGECASWATRSCDHAPPAPSRWGPADARSAVGRRGARAARRRAGRLRVDRRAPGALGRAVL